MPAARDRRDVPLWSKPFVSVFVIGRQRVPYVQKKEGTTTTEGSRPIKLRTMSCFNQFGVDQNNKQQQMADVVVVGASNMDLISYVDRLPAVGETIHGSRFVTGFGGKGANQCVQAAKMGAATALVRP